MKRYVMSLFIASGLMASQSFANPGNCCYEPPIGKYEYATKDYVDSKVAEINSKLDSIEARISKIRSELATISTIPPNLVEKLNALESAVSDLGKICPTECSERLVKVEKELTELKDKVEKRSKSLEQNIEKSMRK